MKWAKDFKDWIMQGNLIEIAVGLVLALAFADVVKTFVEGLVTPIIAAIGGQPDFAGLSFKINGSEFKYGVFLNALIAFIVVGLVMFFIVKLATRLMKEKAAEPTQYVVEKYDESALNARSADGWEVVSAGEAGVVMKK